MKNISFYKKKIVKQTLLINAALLIVTLLLQQTKWANALVLGTLTGYFVFSESIKTQINILNQKKQHLFFIGFIKRLLIYALPLIVGLKYKSYFTLYPIIYGMVSFQLIYIVIEVIRGIKNIKKRNKKG